LFSQRGWPLPNEQPRVAGGARLTGASITVAAAELLWRLPAVAVRRMRCRLALEGRSFSIVIGGVEWSFERAANGSWSSVLGGDGVAIEATRTRVPWLADESLELEWVASETQLGARSRKPGVEAWQEHHSLSRAEWDAAMRASLVPAKLGALAAVVFSLRAGAATRATLSQLEFELALPAIAPGEALNSAQRQLEHGWLARRNTPQLENVIYEVGQRTTSDPWLRQPALPLEWLDQRHGLTATGRQTLSPRILQGRTRLRFAMQYRCTGMGPTPPRLVITHSPTARAIACELPCSPEPRQLHVWVTPHGVFVAVDGILLADQVLLSAAADSNAITIEPCGTPLVIERAAWAAIR
jgi:ribosomal protein L34